MKLKKRITLRVSILAVYTATFIILMTTFIVAGSLNFNQAITHVANDLMSNASNLVLHELEHEITPAMTIVKATQSLIQHGLVIENDQDLINYSVSIANIFPQDKIPGAVRVMGWGDAQGNSVVTFREDNGTFTTKIIKPNATPPVHYELVRDLSGKVTKNSLPLETYDPRERPWYIAAVNAKNPVWTDIFVAYPHNNPTTAAAAPIYKESGELWGVYEIEIKLLQLSDFLKTLQIGKNGVAFIVNAKGELVAFPGMQKWLGSNDTTPETMLLEINETDRPWLAKSLVKYKETGLSSFSYDHGGIHYLASFRDIEDFKNYGWKIGVVVPESNFVGLLKDKNLLIILIGITILILGIITAMIFSKRIAQSMGLIVEETARIKDFHLEGGKIGQSIIKEVDVLADAIYSMKMNLRAFQKYLPASLVRQLIRSGEEVAIGGAKKTVTIFFSDIEGFTSITETMEPEQLMQHLCEYFDNLSKIITDSGGTIDKFIGDSIMAFWGAPLTDEAHCLHACSAALQCKQRLTELNARWIKEGKAPMRTRIGINTGEALVGNIGSSDRINYTVLGDSVNLASRLEEINRLYQSDIVVSESVFNLVRDKFVFRILDKVKLKGIAGVNMIYELLAETPDQLSFDLEQYQHFFGSGFQAYEQGAWAKAMAFFKSCLDVYPEDTLALIFITRCEHFLQAPPDSDWTGAWESAL
ncbi:MAG: adenylate/guanylate cyclase domain-containing protein [Gammaproteobacteria bacterium]